MNLFAADFHNQLTRVEFGPHVKFPVPAPAQAKREEKVKAAIAWLGDKWCLSPRARQSS